MPSIRVTVSLNTNRTIRAPLLVPTPDFSSTSAYSRTLQGAVFQCAQTKLRLKKPTKIYAHGGKVLVSEQDWHDVLHNDAILLVSAGEEYIGKVDEANLSLLASEDFEASSEDIQRLTYKEPTIHNLASSSFVDLSAIKQLQVTAQTLPGIVYAVAQPDLHPGTKFPIGAVFVSQGWVHPPLIGGDIGCGMAWYRTSLSPEQVEGDKARKVTERLRGLEGTWRTREMREVWLNMVGETVEQTQQGSDSETQRS